MRAIRQPIREPPIEPDWHPTSFRLARRLCKRLRVRIQPHDLDLRMKVLDQHYEGARSAAYVENVVPRSNRRLIEERRSRSIASDQLHERVRTAAGTSRVRRLGDSFFETPISLRFSSSWQHCSLCRDFTEDESEQLLDAAV
jgi:hypothetical protein